MKWGQPGKIYGIGPNPERSEHLIERIVYLLPDLRKVTFPNYIDIKRYVGERGLIEVRPPIGVDHMAVIIRGS
ncbi:MAG TPA: hypothetical protein EYP09_05140 [Anaerolineae bacterium]|nr:hypothetical protein [Anaerolineae bacterium]